MLAIINGSKIKYEVQGAGRAIVLLQGTGCINLDVTELTEAGFKVVVPDITELGSLKGGESKIASEVITLLNYLGIGRSVYAVHPGNEEIIKVMRERFPERLAGVFLMDKDSQQNTENLVQSLSTLRVTRVTRTCLREVA